MNTVKATRPPAATPVDHEEEEEDEMEDDVYDESEDEDPFVAASGPASSSVSKTESVSHGCSMDVTQASTASAMPVTALRAGFQHLISTGLAATTKATYTSAEAAYAKFIRYIKDGASYPSKSRPLHPVYCIPFNGL